MLKMIGWCWWWFVLVVLVCCGMSCWALQVVEVVVYMVFDCEFLELILIDFEWVLQFNVLVKFDVELMKIVGLVIVIMQEKNWFWCDVFWNNEILYILWFQKMGLL